MAQCTSHDSTCMADRADSGADCMMLDLLLQGQACAGAVIVDRAQRERPACSPTSGARPPREPAAGPAGGDTVPRAPRQPRTPAAAAGAAGAADGSLCSGCPGWQPAGRRCATGLRPTECCSSEVRHLACVFDCQSAVQGLCSLVPLSAGRAAPLAERWPASALLTLSAGAAGRDGSVRSFSLSLDWQACSGHTDFEQAQQGFGVTVQLLWCNAAQSRIAGCSSAGGVAVWDCRSGCWPPAKHVCAPNILKAQVIHLIYDAAPLACSGVLLFQSAHAPWHVWSLCPIHHSPLAAFLAQQPETVALLAAQVSARQGNSTSRQPAQVLIAQHPAMPGESGLARLSSVIAAIVRSPLQEVHSLLL